MFKTACRSDCSSLAIWFCSFSNRSASCSSAVSHTVPSGRMKRIDSTVWYALFSTPQHIPLELLDKIPPIMAEPMEEGSGPSFLPKGRRVAFTRPPIAPPCTLTLAPPSIGWMLRQWRPISTSQPSVTDCPDKLVPPARKVTGILSRWEAAKICWISVSLTGCSTAWGTSR